MSEVRYVWAGSNTLDELSNGEYNTCYEGSEIAEEMNYLRQVLNTSKLKVEALERQLEEAEKENTELLIKIKAHKKQALTVAENTKFRELRADPLMTFISETFSPSVMSEAMEAYGSDLLFQRVNAEEAVSIIKRSKANE